MKYVTNEDVERDPGLTDEERKLKLKALKEAKMKTNKEGMIGRTIVRIEGLGKKFGISEEELEVITRALNIGAIDNDGEFFYIGDVARIKNEIFNIIGCWGELEDYNLE